MGRSRSPARPTGMRCGIVLREESALAPGGALELLHHFLEVADLRPHGGILSNEAGVLVGQSPMLGLEPGALRRQAIPLQDDALQRESSRHALLRQRPELAVPCLKEGAASLESGDPAPELARSPVASILDLPTSG
jgi:hypothetical protein